MPDMENHRITLSTSGSAFGNLDVLSFFSAWMCNPVGIGAIAPSGRALAELMASEITSSSGSIIELGPGTGVFTRAILAQGAREKDLTLVEYLPGFAELLQMRFPEARVLRMDAARLQRHGLFESATVGAVVSGLPLRGMPLRKVICILSGAFRYLRPGGALYQFTYGLGCPVPRPFLDRLGLKATCLGRVLQNVPPATVYRITRRGPIKSASDPTSVLIQESGLDV